jgi:hypothetical protein
MININELEIGDPIIYKAYGVKGPYEAIVTGIGLKKVGIKILSHDGIKRSPYFINVSPKNLRRFSD